LNWYIQFLVIRGSYHRHAVRFGSGPLDLIKQHTLNKRNIPRKKRLKILKAKKKNFLIPPLFTGGI
jgi:hypothetical protein